MRDRKASLLIFKAPPFGWGTCSGVGFRKGRSSCPAGRGLKPRPRIVAKGDVLLFVVLVILLWHMPIVGTLLAQKDVSFIARREFAVGRDPVSVAIGDFNGDKIPDLAVANSGSRDLSILIGHGQGTFEPAQRVEVGSNPTSIAVGDFNGDGFPDLAVAAGGTFEDPGSAVAILLNNGNGTFAVTKYLEVGSGSCSVTVADFNGDTFPDLAVANWGSNTVSILLGNGDGTFQAAQDMRVGSQPVSIAVADFNGDKIPDLAVADYGEYRYLTGTSISILLGIGDGTFQPAPSLWAGARPTSVAAGDFNGDKIPDLAVTAAGYRGHGVLVVLGNGDGTFQPIREIRAGIRAEFVTVGDFNGDAIPDLLMTSGSTGSLSILLGIGDGTFEAERFLNAGDVPYAIAVSDLNGDGVQDIVTANFNLNAVSVVLGNRDGTFRVAPTIQAGNLPNSVAVGNFNQDQRPDLAVANQGSNDVSIFIGTGHGLFESVRYFELGGKPVIIGDFNGDNRPDLAVLTGPWNAQDLTILLSNADGSFRKAQTIPIGSFPYSISVQVVDLNGDGRPDLLVIAPGSCCTSYATTISVLLGNGDGTFRLTQRLTLGSSSFTIIARDFNGDGRPDLLAITVNPSCCPLNPSTLSIMLGNGDGTFQAARTSELERGSSLLAVDDFNGDGLPDLVMGIRNSTNMFLLLANGDGTFRSTPRFNLGGYPSWAKVADFNGDDQPDLAVMSYSPNPHTLLILLGNGDGTFKTPRSFDVGFNFYSIAIADFNGDTLQDLAIAREGVSAAYPSSVSIFLSNGDGTFRTAQQVRVGFSRYTATLMAVSDFNGDKIPDLAVANGDNGYPNTGTVFILLGYGDGTFRTVQNFVAGFNPWSMTVTDFNVDKIPDLALFTGDTSYPLVVAIGNGDGTFRAIQKFAVGPNPTSVIVGDFNRDKIPDLAVANARSNNVSILLGNGDSTFRTTQAMEVGSGPTSLAAADFNGDKIPDLAVTIGPSNVAILAGYGDGTFGLIRNLVAGSPRSSLTVDDFNGDKIPDLALTNYGSNTVSILLGNGDATFRPARNFAVGHGPRSIAVGDFNGDKIPDLAVANQGSNTVSILLGIGDGTFRTAQDFGVGTGHGPVFVAVGDFNGDAIADLAVANWDSNNVSILAGNGDGTFRPAQNFGVGFNPSSMAVGDFNGDGRTDLAITNWGTTSVSILINDGPPL